MVYLRDVQRLASSLMEPQHLLLVTSSKARLVPLWPPFRPLLTPLDIPKAKGQEVGS